MRPAYDDSVFINCPFDEAYRPLFRALVFTIHACGMIARSALEVDDGAEVRIDKITRIIGQCRHSIHDISRTELDSASGLPRMNMPFELGLFLGARRFGTGAHETKTCIIFDRERYRYQQFLSDIAGQDIRAHGEEAGEVIRAVRNAFSTLRSNRLPSGRLIQERYEAFVRDLANVCAEMELDHEDLGHRDLAEVIIAWLARSAAALHTSPSLS